MTDTRTTTSARRLPAPGRPVPVSTYRVQLGADLTFDDVAAQVPYLADLGVTHVYLSPVLRAAPGSTHGYDVVDHREIAPVLGGLFVYRLLGQRKPHPAASRREVQRLTNRVIEEAA